MDLETFKSIADCLLGIFAFTATIAALHKPLEQWIRHWGTRILKRTCVKWLVGIVCAAFCVAYIVMSIYIPVHQEKERQSHNKEYNKLQKSFDDSKTNQDRYSAEVSAFLHTTSTNSRTPLDYSMSIFDFQQGKLAEEQKQLTKERKVIIESPESLQSLRSELANGQALEENYRKQEELQRERQEVLDREAQKQADNQRQKDEYRARQKNAQIEKHLNDQCL
jgi:hypothetical protein